MEYQFDHKLHKPKAIGFLLRLNKTLTASLEWSNTMMTDKSRKMVTEVSGVPGGKMSKSSGQRKGEEVRAESLSRVIETRWTRACPGPGEDRQTHCNGGMFDIYEDLPISNSKNETRNSRTFIARITTNTRWADTRGPESPSLQHYSRPESYKT